MVNLSAEKRPAGGPEKVKMPHPLKIIVNLAKGKKKNQLAENGMTAMGAWTSRGERRL